MPFNTSGDGTGADYFRATPGMLRGVFLNCTDGPVFTRKNDKGEIEDAPQMRWNFRLKDLAGNPLWYINEDTKHGDLTATVSKLVPQGTPNAIEAVTDALSSTATGPKSKARSWFAALLNRPIEGALSESDIAALLAECEGKEVYLTFAYNTATPPRVAITGIVPMPQQP